eukprot:TRINITY_DN13722_c0_g1_i1.p1 TRINITY_DN13722_c0_g1~~TRINITY_DN13722_c0_g1_i1.p1  ORF type:complete len:393 (+),score=73.11 TRINITY_DN13722_c0_g1_i1:100-1278(+)
MSIKKAEPTAPAALLGKVANHLKMGIVGLPNVGKSTLFNILTKLDTPAANYPFCTKEPNTARVEVLDPRFDWLVDHYKPKSAVRAFLEIVDIAGLVKGASENKGLGNAFLSNIRSVDGIFHVIRVFEDTEVTHVEGEVDPVRDLEIIHEELLLKDLEWISKIYDGLSKLAARDKTKRAEFEIVAKVYDWIAVQKKDVRFGTWTAKEIDWLNEHTFLTAKPVIYLVNLSEEDFKKQKNKWLGKIKQWVDSRSKDIIIPFSASLESLLFSIGPESAAKYCQENKVRTMVSKIVSTGFQVLHLSQFFTVGPDEVKAWTIHNTMKAPQAGAVIHSDFEQFFICCEVMAFEDLKALGSEIEVRAKGKYYQQGKNYVVQDGDIILFKHGGGGAGKKKK